MYRVRDLRMHDRLGTYPSGKNGLSMTIDICNVGTQTVDFRAAMNPDHPIYGFILCREHDGRFEQISDWSYLKHAFASINSSLCGSCGGGSGMPQNCSDTYTYGLNANRYYLGPPAEVDPWLCVWNPVGSHFDRGEPDVGFPQNQDGIRSLSSSQASALPPTRHKIEVSDAEMAVPGARFFYGVYVVIEEEPEANRENNLRSRETRATWTGSGWSFSDFGNGLVYGTFLQHWSGAKLGEDASNQIGATNGSDDGRVYVASKVTGPDARGLWRYEYAIHNRDNSRGIAALRIPICSATTTGSYYFHDVDDDPANEWTTSQSVSELAFLAPASGNLVEWNTIYNFGFWANAGPVNGSVTLDQGRPGPGAAQITLEDVDVPGIVFNPRLGDGCGAPAPELYASGTPPFATIPNAAFALRCENMAPSSLGAVVLSGPSAPTSFGSCTVYPSATGFLVLGALAADSQGVATIPAAIPNNTALEGADLYWQAVEFVTNGPFLGIIELSNGLRTRVGNSLTDCP
jgi:hypothetical protein